MEHSSLCKYERFGTQKSTSKVYCIETHTHTHTQLLKTHQFSATKHKRLARAVAGESGLPGTGFCFVCLLFSIIPLVIILHDAQTIQE